MRFVDFLIGIAVLLMGIVPLTSNIKALSTLSGIIGTPGKITYQGILIAIGLLTIFYAFSEKKYIPRR
jgi:hypothetical protein